ncbi:MAG: recombinase family protein [Acidobacteriaceae bacterium]
MKNDRPDSKDVSKPKLQRVAEYVRMSTEHQQYSTENQSDVIKRYAAAREMEIVRTYEDSGKSGLNLAGRNSLQELLKDVESGSVDFDSVLVYDVSRWGRFQDTDEGAFYEYLCKRANIQVHYCAEQFENDGSLPSNVLKTLKRAMAGEYSRELSVKVFAGQCRLIELGFRQGGPAGFGLRRQLVDQNGASKQILARGEQKSLQTDRVILVPGPEFETQIIREIYDLFTKDGVPEVEIADRLNIRGILTDLDRPWSRGAVHQVLTNPKYIGVNVYNRRSFKLKRKRVVNPPEMWIHRRNAFKPIIGFEQFECAQRIIQSRHQYYSDEQLIEKLRQLLKNAGMLSGILIDETAEMPSSSAYRSRFKSLLRAYELVGYSPERDYSYLETNRMLRQFHGNLCDKVVSDLRALGSEVRREASIDLLIINESVTVSLILARCQESQAGSLRWLFRLERSLDPDVTIAARLAAGNQEVLDYYLLPSLDEFEDRIRLAPKNGILLDVYRYDNLDLLFQLTRRTTIKEPE